MGFEHLEDRCLLATIVVGSTTDLADGNTGSIAALVASPGGDGVISLREAITAANNTPNSGGPDEIQFAIPGAGPHVISPTSALPTIVDPVVIDGYTQSGASANTNAPDQALNTVLMVELAGNLSGGSTGLRLGAGSSGSTIRGLAVNRFSNAIWIDSSENTISGNYIGTNVGGTAALANAANGVLLIAAANNTIGGTSPAAANLISGNGTNGITIVSAGANDNFIQGNRIGTDLSGDLDVGNGIYGIFTDQALRTTIGGTAIGSGNLISGNDDHGIYLQNVSSDAVIEGNTIGANLSASAVLGNGGGGIQIENSSNIRIGGASAGAGNVIVGNTLNGVTLAGGSGSSVTGNWIGTTAAGTMLGNLASGVLIVNSSRNTVGGDTGGNTIAFNGGDGVGVFRTGFFVANRNLIQANSIFDNAGLGIDSGPARTLGNLG